MAFSENRGENVQGFLKGVTSLNRKELGRGAYGKVYSVKYCQTVCAAKEIHSILIEDVGETERRLTIQSFLRECRQCSTLRHPNVIQFLGVYYPTGGGGANRMRLPVMVMDSLALLDHFFSFYTRDPQFLGVVDWPLIATKSCILVRMT